MENSWINKPSIDQWILISIIVFNTDQNLPTKVECEH